MTPAITPDKIMSKVERNRFLRTIAKAREQAIKRLDDAHAAGQRMALSDFRIALDCFLFDLIANTGLRISEALALQFPDLREGYIMIQAKNSKNRKLGTVYFGDHTKQLISELKSFLDRHRKVHTFLLFSRDGRKADRSYAHRRFKHLLAVSGIPDHYSIHSLRHTYATFLLDEGRPLQLVRDQLRHSSIAITSKYLHTTKATRDLLKDIC